MENFCMKNITVAENCGVKEQPPMLRMRLCYPTQAKLKGVRKEAALGIYSEKCDVISEEQADGTMEMKVNKHLYGSFTLPVTNIMEAELEPLKEQYERIRF